MATRAPFLKTRYSGYHHRHVPQEDTELTHVGPDTPCGEYMRRFWQPVCYSDDLKDLPLAIKILGEELVVFRDGSGAVGLLDGTAHTAALRSIRPGRRQGDTLLLPRLAVRRGRHDPRDTWRAGHQHAEGPALHGAYPVHETHGMIFGYMGPPEQMPAFPTYDSFDRPAIG